MFNPELLIKPKHINFALKIYYVLSHIIVDEPI